MQKIISSELFSSLNLKNELPEILIGENACQNFLESSEILIKYKRILLISDINCFEFMGKDFQEFVAEKCNIEKIIFEKSPQANRHSIDKCLNLGAYDCYIAVGSGSICDIVKYSSFKVGKPFVIFPTAPSVNAYTSSTASIKSNDKIKESYNTHLPKAIILDKNKFNNIPTRLVRSGVGDSLAKNTCIFDWYLSHIMIKTSFDIRLYDLLQESERSLYQIIESDHIEWGQLISDLYINLFLSGYTMHLYGSSMPASQSEHMMVHFLETTKPEIFENYYHGELVAGAMFHIYQLQDNLLKRNYEVKKSKTISLSKLQKLHEIEDIFELQNHVRKKLLQDIVPLRLKYKKYQQICKKIGLNLLELKNIFDYAEPNFTEIALARDRFTILDLVN